MQKKCVAAKDELAAAASITILFSGFAGMVTADSHQLVSVAEKRAVVRDVDLSGPNLTIDFQMEAVPEPLPGKSEYLVQMQNVGSCISIRRMRPAIVALDLDAVPNAIRVQTSGSRNHIALVIDGNNATMFVNGESERSRETDRAPGNRNGPDFRRGNGGQQECLDCADTKRFSCGRGDKPRSNQVLGQTRPP